MLGGFLYPGLNESDNSKVNLLDYLILVAQSTQGAEVWRALFAEIRKSIMDKRTPFSFTEQAKP